jgi:hypothetical protein
VVDRVRTGIYMYTICYVGMAAVNIHKYSMNRHSTISQPAVTVTSGVDPLITNEHFSSQQFLR